VSCADATRYLEALQPIQITAVDRLNNGGGFKPIFSKDCSPPIPAWLSEFSESADARKKSHDEIRGFQNDVETKDRAN
jgi:hypothetical protein